MRRRSLSGVVILSIAALTAAACGNSDTPTTPTPPTATPLTETFSGTLTVNGGQTFPFVATQAGTVTATLDALDPDTSVVGVSIGTSTGTTCQVVLSNDNSGINAQITGAVTSSGTLCARVYDASGKLEGPVNFTLSVEHF